LTRARLSGHPDLGAGLDPALELIRRLASEVGPRRPCSEAEAQAARVTVDWLGARGIQAAIEPFQGYSSFAHPYGLILGASLAGSLLRRRRAGDGLALGALAALALEGDLRVTPVSNLLARRPSGNVVASVAPADEERQRICLGGHLDTTRSGLMFHPRVVPHLRTLFQAPVLSAAIVGADPVLRRLPGARALRAAAIAGLVFGLVLLAERELRGQDVPGANDNASGCGVAAQLLAECAAQPLRHTRVDLLLSGCEESGVLGAQSYVRSRRAHGARVVLINFDSVGGDAPVRYVLGEGMSLPRPATRRLVALVEQIAERRPELGLSPAADTAALTTDATVALAHGCEAITFLARGETIPNYHWPTDTYENVSPGTVGRALEAGRELLRELDSAS
jgi:hypothetical protein